MTKVQSIVIQMDDLTQDELDKLLLEILKRLDRAHQMKSVLRKYRGSGKGVWKKDAQDYVNQLREEDRL